MADLDRVVVTGATGFLGSRLTQTLVADNTARRLVTSGRSLRAADRLTALGTEFIPGDLRDQTVVQRLMEGATALVHCAALSSAWGSYQTFFEHNVRVTQHLIDAAVANRIGRFVYVSSPSIYATLADRLGVGEHDPLPTRFLNAYARTKYEAEQLVIRQLTRHRIPYVIIRPRALIGAGDTVIMPRLLDAQARNRLFVVGDGQNWTDLTAVANVADALVLALTAGGDALNQVYNITNGEPVQLWPQLDAVFEQLGRPFRRRRLPYQLALTVARLQEQLAALTGHEPALTRYTLSILAHSMTLDITSARTRLGYAPKQTTAEAVVEFTDWYKAGQP